MVVGMVVGAACGAAMLGSHIRTRGAVLVVGAVAVPREGCGMGGCLLGGFRWRVGKV